MIGWSNENEICDGDEIGKGMLVEMNFLPAVEENNISLGKNYYSHNDDDDADQNIVVAARLQPCILTAVTEGLALRNLTSMQNTSLLFPQSSISEDLR